MVLRPLSQCGDLRLRLVVALRCGGTVRLRRSGDRGEFRLRLRGARGA